MQIEQLFTTLLHDDRAVFEFNDFFTRLFVDPLDNERTERIDIGDHSIDISWNPEQPDVPGLTPDLTLYNRTVHLGFIFYEGFENIVGDRTVIRYLVLLHDLFDNWTHIMWSKTGMLCFCPNVAREVEFQPFLGR
jgi:hypothetical protein